MGAALRQGLEAIFVRRVEAEGAGPAADHALAALSHIDSFVDPELVTRGAILDTLGALDGIRTEGDFKTQILYAQNLLSKGLRDVAATETPLAGQAGALLDGYLHFVRAGQWASESFRPLLAILEPTATPSLADRIRTGAARDVAAFLRELPTCKKSLHEAIDGDALDEAQRLLERVREIRSEVERVRSEVEPMVAWAGELTRMVAALDERRRSFEVAFDGVLSDLAVRFQSSLARREEWSSQADQVAAASEPASVPDGDEPLALRSVTQTLRVSDILKKRGDREPPPVAVETAAELPPEDVESIVQSGNEAFKARNFEQAVSCYERAIALDPASALAHFNLFQVRVQQYKLAEAFEGYRRAVELESSYALAPPEYRILGILGSGPKGLVLDAQRTDDDRLLTLRLLKSSLCANPTLVARFQQEAKRLASIDHPGIVKPTRFIVHAGRQLVESERLEGRSVKRILNLRGVVPLERALWYVRQIGQALAEAHVEGIVHGDLKPSNVYEEIGQRIRITDWGLIHLRNTARLADTAEQFSRTYMPPEQKTGERLDVRCDVYATCLILFEMLLGERPTSEMPLPSQVDDTIPEDVDDLIRTGCAKDPARRFQSMEDLLEALDGIRSEAFAKSPDVIALPESQKIELEAEPPARAAGIRAAGQPPRGMAAVAGGPFRRGSDQKSDESPIRTIDLEPFFVDLRPVTHAEYQRFVDETGHRVPFVNAPWAKPFNWKKGRHPRELRDHPVVLVSWYDAVAYAQWAQKRLPTEAEWEKAARGTDGRTYPWGEGIDRSRCNFKRNQGGTTPVGQFEKDRSPYGCADMAGNVWEWCADWYQAGYYRTAPAASPPGPESGKDRVLRGGAWDTTEEALTCTFRYHQQPHIQNPFIGFRCARDV